MGLDASYDNINDSQNLGLWLRVCTKKKKKSYFLTKAYVVGTLKNRLNETVLLSTQSIC